MMVERLWVYDEIIRKGLEHARAQGMDLTATLERINPGEIETYGVLPPRGMTDMIRKAHQRGLEWPEDLPLPVVACREGYCETLDGHHRIAAAQRLRLDRIPAIVASLETWYRLKPVIDQPDVIPYEDMIAILAEAGSELIRKNLAIEAALRERLES